ncbi:Uncharacterised protein [Bordetella pertussis]|nr:Uncharacterised protein [Bordetella pertussis]CFU02829.1 Uncharacterised protein [Bordetella pertussis]CFV96551.1 Uncharacterised protein [Bordetella pertussis]CPM73485.1 Uncharacterised protein [Bordetella pertussis]CPO97948.1 Uncharacterised protein [Bordetella pertussis]
MAAYHPVQPAPARFAGQRFLEIGDEGHRVLHLVLEVLRQRPVVQAQPVAQPVEVVVQPQRGLVERVAQVGQPFAVLDDAVELVAVQHQQLDALGRDVDVLVQDLDIAESEARELPREFVVVAGDEHHPGAVARLAQDALDHVIVGARPVPVLAQLPAVHDVAHQVQRVRIVMVEEIEQEFGLASGRSQVNVGNPQRAPMRGMDLGHGRFHSGCHCPRMKPSRDDASVKEP